MSEQNLSIINNPAEKRFEVTVEGHLAMVQYIETTHNITFTHTEVPRALEGQGIGGRLAKTALDYALEKNLKILPTCPFVAAYIRRHPEYQPFVYGYKPKN
jgi:predicted GNAT family acetyltransferase